MENLELIELVESAAIDVLTEAYNEKDLFCEIERVNYSYCEGDYDDPIVTVKGRCGRYNKEKETTDTFYNFTNEFELYDVGKRSRDFIAGMIYMQIVD